jgi:hypothetical protein
LISLETMLVAGALIFIAGFVILVFVLRYWSQHDFIAISNVLPAVVGTTLMVIGAQNALGGLLLGIISGHEADFLNNESDAPVAHECRAMDKKESSSRTATG